VILLLGGTSDSVEIAHALAAHGHAVIFSQATDVPLPLHDSPLIEVRRGRMDQGQICTFLRERRIVAIVDAAHPFAKVAHANAYAAAQQCALPYIHWMRKSSEVAADEDLHLVADHATAAALAVQLGKPILLTTGSRNLRPYLDAANEARLPLYARVLPGAESENACVDAGFPHDDIIFARGPFSIDDTLTLLQRLHIGTLISKESGPTGGVPEKIAAAKQANCNVILIEREPYPPETQIHSIDEILQWVEEQTK